jgi:hypothetical protein
VNKPSLLITVLLALACAKEPPPEEVSIPRTNYPGSTTETEVINPFTYTPIKSGQTNVDYYDFKTIITDPNQYYVYITAFTGEPPQDYEQYFINTNVMMIVHPRTLEEYFFTIARVSTNYQRTLMNIYYYTTPYDLPKNIGKRYFQFYTIPKSVQELVFIN